MLLNFKALHVYHSVQYPVIVVTEIMFQTRWLYAYKQSNFSKASLTRKTKCNAGSGLLEVQEPVRALSTYKSGSDGNMYMYHCVVQKISTPLP